MAWTENSPDETKSVAQNAAPMLANTAFIKSSMENDHFWNTGGKEGRHQFAQMPKDETVGGPVLGANMDLVYYAKEIAGFDIQPFVKNTAVMQLLGIRALALFNVAGGVVTLVYSHNVTSVTRASTGKYTVNFTTNLPTVNYLVLGNGVRGSDGGILVSIQGNATIGNVKKVDKCLINSYTQNGNLVDPTQVWVVFFGG